jgi:membrane protein required for beta-lactamase induction
LMSLPARSTRLACRTERCLWNCCEWPWIAVLEHTSTIGLSKLVKVMITSSGIRSWCGSIRHFLPTCWCHHTPVLWPHGCHHSHQHLPACAQARQSADTKPAKHSQQNPSPIHDVWSRWRALCSAHAHATTPDRNSL